VTVVYVTHDQSEALTMSDRIAVFNDGIIQQLSSPSDLYERPDNSFVAQFIGENNRLDGMVTAVKGKECSVKLDSGETVTASAINIEGKGKRTPLSLRPERIEINPTGKTKRSTINAKIEELIYLGDHIRTRMSAGGSSDFIVKVPNKSGHKLLEEGKTVKVGWLAEDCRALDPIL